MTEEEFKQRVLWLVRAGIRIRDHDGLGERLQEKVEHDLTTGRCCRRLARITSPDLAEQEYRRRLDELLAKGWNRYAFYTGTEPKPE